ncbi:MAG: AbrB/MazE/SpoVT family DNA-binding domain-containing protein [Candidatus Nanoarchaeia archaeon]
MENEFIKTLRVSDKGQISIPNSVRQKLGIERGDNLILFEIEGKILLEKQQKVSDKMKDEFKDVLHFSEQSLKEVWDNSEDEIWSQYLEN